MTDVRQQTDRLPAGTLLGIGTAGIAVTAITVGIVAWWAQDHTAVVQGPRTAVHVPVLEEQLVRSRTSRHDPLGVEERELRHWAWVDREREVVRVPIDIAMELVATGHRPEEAP